MSVELRPCGLQGLAVCDGNCEKCRTIATTETVYNRYTDTAGNYHWTGTYSGKHIVKMDGTSINTASDFYDDNGRLLNNPISEAEPVKHGRWNKVVHSNNHITYYCPKCGSIFNKGCADLGDYNYCPNCGTDMREVEDD